VVVSTEDYPKIIAEMQRHDGALTLETRNSLARTAFMKTSSYDAIVTAYLSRALRGRSREDSEHGPGTGGIAFGISSRGELHTSESAPAIDSEEFSLEAFHGSLPTSASWTISKSADLRYGENPHQIAGLYKLPGRSGIANAEQLSGKEMSFNNYVDADAAWHLVSDFDETACAIIKHTNPAGVALDPQAVVAYRRALATDPTSAFGGMTPRPILFNICTTTSGACGSIIRQRHQHRAGSSRR
jgi:phosphoribosylaminoimidazolecarboxamide formyltransferase/IMP cyclohydrolase